MAGFPEPVHVSLRDALTEVAERTTAAGVRTVVDPDALQVPGAVVYVNTVDFDTLSAGVGGYDLTVDVLLVAGGAGTLPALDQLDAMLTTVRQLWTVPEATAVSVTLPGQSSDPLPALRATVAVNVTPTATP